jgi:hypothetical protein
MLKTLKSLSLWSKVEVIAGVSMAIGTSATMLLLLDRAPVPLEAKVKGIEKSIRDTFY